MSNKNFNNQNYHNYNQYGKKTESTQVEEKEETKEVITPTDADIAPVEEADDVLTEDAEETNAEVQTKPAYGIVNCSKLNVRKGPSKNTDSLCVIESGSKLEVEPFNEEWIKATTAEGVSGYCMLEFVDVE